MLATPSALRRGGVLGMNRRNSVFLMGLNPRAQYPLVDDKSITKALCREHEIPVPETYALIERFRAIRGLGAVLAGHREFVVKPARGSGGRGVMVIIDRDGDAFVRSTGEVLDAAALRYHVSAILSGLHSLGGLSDRAIVEQRIRPHPLLAPLAVGGTPDLRIIVHRDEPLMAMLRLPTSESGGRANLHQGGIGVGIDLEGGTTTHAVQSGRPIDRHPDTGLPLAGVAIPHWPEALATASRLARAVGLGYLGVDLALDEALGPVVLEGNGRPGLSIQMANRLGLLAALRDRDARRG